MLPELERDHEIDNFLHPLLPPGVSPEAFVSRETLDALRYHRRELAALGFELEVQESSLGVRHRTRGFEFVTRFSDQDDLGERRRLFGALRDSFGTFWDRFSWFVQPSPSITTPYEHVKAVLGACQTARMRLRRVK